MSGGAHVLLGLADGTRSQLVKQGQAHEAEPRPVVPASLPRAGDWKGTRAVLIRPDGHMVRADEETEDERRHPLAPVVLAAAGLRYSGGATQSGLPVQVLRV